LRQRGFVVWLRASVAQQLRRLERDRQRPLLRAPDRRARLETMAQQRDPLYADVADLVVAPENLSVSQAAERVAQALDRLWQRPASAA